MSDHFPREILAEILHRLPLKSLGTCTSVCKAWNSLITDHAFISDHLNRTIQASNGDGSLFLQTTEALSSYILDYKEFYSLYSDNQQIDDNSFREFPLTHLFRFYDCSAPVGTCNGLVCFADYTILDLAALFIWNPSIRKYVELPEPIVTSSREDEYQVFFGFGFDSRKNDYKVVRFVTRKNEEDSLQVQVYNLASRSWGSISVRAPRFLLSEHFWKISQMFVNGVLHWVVSRRSDGQVHNFILSFDVVEETFGEITLPPHLKESPFVSILGGGHSLAVLHTYSEERQIFQREEFFSIWVMREYGVVESWTEVFHCDSERYGGISTVLALRSSGEVVLLLSSGAIVLIDPVNELVKALGDRRWHHAFVGHYVESLFLINGEPDFLSYQEL